MTHPFKIPTSCDTATWREGDTHWGHRESDKWPEGFPKPRTCSYCGSANPDDILVLLKMGWECEMSTKSYKSYWHPPGYLERLDMVFGDINAFVEAHTAPPKHINPVPPVKLYSNHVTNDMVSQINAQILINRAKRAP